jgi:hypothetical protein
MAGFSAGARTTRPSWPPHHHYDHDHGGGGGGGGVPPPPVAYLQRIPPSAEAQALIAGGGVPAAHRAEVWERLINNWVGDERQFNGPDYYLKMSDLRDKIKPKPPLVHVKQIELDLLRTFPTNKYFHRDGQASATSAQPHEAQPTHPWPARPVCVPG